MLQALKYIILFLLGYKVIKALFKEEPQPARNKMPQDRMRVNEPASPPNHGRHQYGDAEAIDYEEVK